MGMSIDKHIEVLKSYHHGFTGCAGNLQDSIDVAIDIMQKYQKIQEIVTKWEEGVHSGVSCSFDRMEDIKEVLEDGNDDR